MARGSGRAKVTNDNSQFELFTFTARGYEATESTRPDRERIPRGDEAIADRPSAKGGHPERSGLESVLGGDAPNDPIPSSPTPLSAVVGPWPGLGNEVEEIRLPRHPQIPPLPESEPRRNQNNYRITDDDGLGLGSLKAKCRNNLATIDLLIKLEKEGRRATDEEKRVLVRYVGWGGLPQVFDPSNNPWKAERERLEAMLTPDELHSARATTLNAHYTAPVVIRAMYSALQHFGFEHGRILEPACGLGHFIGLMPDEMHGRSQITGIEIDSITARLAKTLYPDADIRHQAFETAKLANGFYDVSISNIPFGDYEPYDPNFKKWKFVIHDYFFAAALEKIRPGGLLLFVTSRGTLDKMDGGLREYIAGQADLLGAIRLPNDAFKKNANTEVTTDIVMLRKRLAGESPSGPAWRVISPEINAANENIVINDYFAAHPEMILGQMRLQGRMYKQGEPTCVSNGHDLGEQLGQAIALLPKAVYGGPRAAATVLLPAAETSIPAPEHVKPNAFALVGGQLAVREGDAMRILEGLAAATAQRIRGLVRVRDAVRRCLRSQLDGTDESDVIAAREQLNQSYDWFTGKFGSISERVNAIAFRGDPDLPLLLSLENFDPESGRASKAAIFRERTIQPHRPVMEVREPKDALLVTLNERGYVDLDHVSSLLHRSAQEILPDLRGAVFFNPQGSRWETEDEYLSGNVRAKLLAAEAAVVIDPQFRGNIEALRAVQPTDLNATEIDARLGSAWIPAEDIGRFAQVLLGERGITVSHAPELGLWSVQSGWGAKGSVANTTEWGTDRRSALELLEEALNLRTPTIYDYDARAERDVVNAPATEAARDKQQKIKDRFKEWVWTDDDQRERLVRKYNDEFNNVRLRTFNGDHLTLPGASPSVVLRPHQKAAVWRILQTPNCLLAHVVGAGKTYTMVAAAMELKRLGLAQKPLFVVPNHMLGQFSAELLTLGSEYPAGNEGRFRQGKAKDADEPHCDWKLGRRDHHPFWFRETAALTRDSSSILQRADAGAFSGHRAAAAGREQFAHR
jgi:hypothetical protein